MFHWNSLEEARWNEPVPWGTVAFCESVSDSPETDGIISRVQSLRTAQKAGWAHGREEGKCRARAIALM